MKNPHSMNFGEYETPAVGAPVPASVTLLVSLFLILITFFIIINRSAVYDTNKKDTIIKSVNNKFGQPGDDAINFGMVIPPKMEDFTIELENLFGNNAKIKSTVSGDEVSILMTKNFMYFSDEVQFREDKMDLLLKLQDILQRWSKTANLRITYILGQDNYELDKQRLQNFRRAMSRSNIDVGMEPNNKESLSIVIKYD